MPVGVLLRDFALHFSPPADDVVFTAPARRHVKETTNEGGFSHIIYTQVVMRDCSLCGASRIGKQGHGVTSVHIKDDVH